MRSSLTQSSRLVTIPKTDDGSLPDSSMESNGTFISSIIHNDQRFRSPDKTSRFCFQQHDAFFYERTAIRPYTPFIATDFFCQGTLLTNAASSKTVASDNILSPTHSPRMSTNSSRHYYAISVRGQRNSVWCMQTLCHTRQLKCSNRHSLLHRTGPQTEAVTLRSTLLNTTTRVTRGAAIRKLTVRMFVCSAIQSRRTLE